MNEQEFGEKLQELKEKAFRQGMCLSDADIRESFGDMMENEEQKGHLLAYFKKVGISVGDAEEVNEFLSMEDQSYLDNYLEALDSCKKLDDANFEAAIKSAAMGDEQAVLALTNHFLMEVVSLARLYAGQGVLLEDLIGEGNLALAVVLTEAIGQFGCIDAEKNLALEVEGFVGKHMMDAMERLINVELKAKQADEELAELVNRVADAAGELSRELLRDVTPAELSQNTDLKPDEIYEAIRLSGKVIEGIAYGEDEDGGQ